MCLAEIVHKPRFSAGSHNAGLVFHLIMIACRRRFALVSVLLSNVLGPGTRQPKSAHECGIRPSVATPRTDVGRFYRRDDFPAVRHQVAFLYPWAMALGDSAGTARPGRAVHGAASPAILRLAMRGALDWGNGSRCR
jgi:hypothetical protein